MGGRRTHLNACLRSLGQPVMACATLRAWMKSKESSLCVHGCSASSYEADVICDIEVGEGGHTTSNLQFGGTQPGCVGL